jgi:hypothetical protein
MSEFFYTAFGKLVAIHIAECCKLLHEYSVLEPPGHVDCWHTQHFWESWGPQTLANNSIIPI